MKYLFINSVFGVRSTGKIVMDQCHRLKKEGHQCVAAYGREILPDSDMQTVRIGSARDYWIHALLSRALDLHGLGSKTATVKFLEYVETYSPDVIWLHNLHGYYINYEVLFRWLKDHPNIKKFWTLHDCWSFTGHCAYFTVARCGKWKGRCCRCSQLRKYPITYGPDRSAVNYIKKKEAFTGIDHLTLITPSRWLAGLVKESFLKEYPVEVVYNSVDKEIFKPTQGDFREKYGLEGKYIVLAVAVGWEETKGFPDMLKLRSALPVSYVIVLVGTTIRQAKTLPKGMIGIPRTADQTELAVIYTSADVFVNPTHQDNYPTVNLEAAACGTPVITYDVGGSPESVPPENVVPEGDICKLAKRVLEICEQKHVD